MAKHRSRKKPASKKSSQAVSGKKNSSQSNYDDPINSFFQAYTNENFDDYQAVREELTNLRSLVSDTLNSNNRYRAEILESYNILSKLVSINSSLNSFEFKVLNKRMEMHRLDELRFDLSLIKTLLDKVNQMDDDVEKLSSHEIARINDYLVKHLKISDYLLNNGFLLIKIYYKILNLKNFLSDKILNCYIKARLLIIYFELLRIDELLDAQPASVVKDQQDFKSVLVSYKDFVLVLINQLNDAIEEKNSEQINECLNILKDVEKMYESFRMNFLFEQELEEYNHQIMEKEYEEELDTPSTAKTTISSELPYLMQAFDSARSLEKEISTYKELDTNVKTHTTPQKFPTGPGMTIKHVKEPAHIHSHIQPQRQFGVTNNMGFNNNLLNSIYGLPKAAGSAHFHSEVD